MFSKVVGKVSGRLRFLYRKQNFLDLKLRRMLCNALIQPHFDYASSAWYPNLNKKCKHKIQTMQNKCIRFCLSLGNRHHIGTNEFKEINWLPSKERFEQSICTKVYNFFNEKAPIYIKDIFSNDTSPYSTRASVNKLKIPRKRTEIGKNSIAFNGPKFWNQLPSDTKSAKSRNSFTHSIKREYFRELGRSENENSVYTNNACGRFSRFL